MLIRPLSNAQSLTIAFLGGLLALAAGTAAGVGYGAPTAGVLLASAFGVGAISLYLRDPVGALICLWVIVLLNPPLTTFVGHDTSAGIAVRYSDEVLVLLFGVLTVWQRARHGKRLPLWFVLPVAAMALFGLLGAAFHQVPLAVAIPGAWLGLKLWVMVGIALLLPWRQTDIERVYKVLTTTGVLAAVYGLADLLTGGAVSSALNLQSFDIPAGKARADSVHGIFAGPYGQSLFMSILFALAFARFAGKRSKADLALAVLFAVSVLLTWRLKGFLSLAAVVMIVVFVQGWMQGRARTPVVLAGTLLVGGMYLAMASVITTQVNLYTSSEATARAQLYLTGEEIAADNFPLGVGFGRFGSFPSRENYSPVYDEYGLSSVYGLSRKDPRFIGDIAWPSVLGEAGYAGLAAYAVGLVFLGLVIIRRLRTAAAPVQWIPLAALCILVVILTDSLGSPALFDWVPAASFALLLGPALLGRR